MRVPALGRRVLGLSAGLALFCACVDDLIADPSFDMWCGGELCHWELERGHVDRVATWHRADYGTSFRDKGTRISQGSSSAGATCLHIELIADAVSAAKLTLTLDFENTPELDWEHTLPKSAWRRHEFWVYPPASGGSFVIGAEKRGEGRAVLAQLEVSGSDPCVGPEASE